MNAEAERLQRIIDGTRRLVFFGGAGVSTESGIPDFRGQDGLCGGTFEGLHPEEILSASFFALQPGIFFAYYRQALLHPEARPNAAHRKLYQLEQADKLRGIVTQNIDGLHRAAGNIRVYELHGTIHENTCLDCGAVYDLQWMLGTSGIPRCPHCGGVVRPGITLYGEALNPWVSIGARREIGACDTMIVAGTSLTVEPAASFLEGFSGKHLVVINRTPTAADAQADLVIRGSVGEVLDFIRC